MNLTKNNSEELCKTKTLIYSKLSIGIWIFGIFYLILISKNPHLQNSYSSLNVLWIAKRGIWLLPFGLWGLIYFSKRSISDSIPLISGTALLKSTLAWLVIYVLTAIFFPASDSIMKIFLIQASSVLVLFGSLNFEIKDLFPLSPKEYPSIIKLCVISAVILLSLLSSIVLAGRTIKPDFFSNLILSSPNIELSRDLIELLLKIIFIPLCEEALFRMGLIGWIRPRVGVVAAVLISAAFFSLLHFQGDIFWARFVAGIFMGWLYVMTGNIAAPFFLHAVSNAGIILLPIIFG